MPRWNSVGHFYQKPTSGCLETVRWSTNHVWAVNDTLVLRLSLIRWSTFVYFLVGAGTLRESLLLIRNIHSFRIDYCNKCQSFIHIIQRCNYVGNALFLILDFRQHSRQKLNCYFFITKLAHLMWIALIELDTYLSIIERGHVISLLRSIRKKTGAFQVSCKEKIQLEVAPRQIPMHHLQSFGKRRAGSAARKLKSGSDLKTFNGDQINILNFNIHIWKIQQTFVVVPVKIQIIANIFWHFCNKEVANYMKSFGGLAQQSRILNTIW